MAQLIATFLLPVPLVLVVLVVGVAALFLGRPRLGRYCCLGAGVLLFLLAWQPFSALLVGPLERQYEPVLEPGHLEDVRYVLVLGGGHHPDPTLPLSARVDEAAMVRLAEGVRLHRALPGTTLVTSGAGTAPTMARTMAELARAWGVEDIALLDEPHNTHAEALAAAEAFGDQHFVLVTSASHMPRAVALFRGAGLDPIPAPTQHMAPAVSGERFWSVRYLRPGAAGLRQSERALYEYLGLAWGWLQGRF